jgi:hypothetical protein
VHSGISHREALIEQFHCPADWKCIIAWDEAAWHRIFIFASHLSNTTS